RRESCLISEQLVHRVPLIVVQRELWPGLAHRLASRATRDKIPPTRANMTVTAWDHVTVSVMGSKAGCTALPPRKRSLAGNDIGAGELVRVLAVPSAIHRAQLQRDGPVDHGQRACAAQRIGAVPRDGTFSSGRGGGRVADMPCVGVCITCRRNAMHLPAAA